MVDGVEHVHGSRWQQGACIIATCHDGVVHRSRVTCPPVATDCELVYDVDPCCGTCRPGDGGATTAAPQTDPPTTAPTLAPSTAEPATNGSTTTHRPGERYR